DDDRRDQSSRAGAPDDRGAVGGDARGRGPDGARRQGSDGCARAVARGRRRRDPGRGRRVGERPARAGRGAGRPAEPRGRCGPHGRSAVPSDAETNASPARLRPPRRAIEHRVREEDDRRREPRVQKLRPVTHRGGWWSSEPAGPATTRPRPDRAFQDPRGGTRRAPGHALGRQRATDRAGPRALRVTEGAGRSEPVRRPRRGRHRGDPGAYHGGARRRGRRAAPSRGSRRADGARRSHGGDDRRPAGVRDGARGRRPARHRPCHGESRMTTATTVLRGGTLLDPAGLRARPADILVENDTIREIGAPGLKTPEGARHLDGRDRLLIPGLINAHTHSHGALARGIVPDAIPLEILLGYAGAVNGNRALEDKHLSAQLSAIELVRKGCTACYDMFTEFPAPTVEG